MIDGITVLNSYEVVTKTAFSWQGFWIGASVVAVIAFIAAIMACDSLIEFFIMFGIAGVIFGTVFGFIFGIKCMPKNIEYTPEYEVTISDEVSMNDFYNRYEIIEQRGEIYVIREKKE